MEVSFRLACGWPTSDKTVAPVFSLHSAPSSIARPCSKRNLPLSCALSRRTGPSSRPPVAVRGPAHVIVIANVLENGSVTRSRKEGLLPRGALHMNA